MVDAIIYSNYIWIKFKLVPHKIFSFTFSSFGKALLSLAEYERAMKELRKAYNLEPYNEAIRKVIQQVSWKLF